LYKLQIWEITEFRPLLVVSIIKYIISSFTHKDEHFEKKNALELNETRGTQGHVNAHLVFNLSSK
jgi:hypothetical protein